MPISSQLRNAIEQSGLSLGEISRATGVAQAILTRFLSGGPGRDRDVRLERTADRLAEFFGLELTKARGCEADQLKRLPRPKAGRPRGNKAS